MPAKILPFSRPGRLLLQAAWDDDDSVAATIAHPALARLYRQWRSWTGTESGLPRRSEIKPEALRPWLGHLAITEIERNPLRIRYRLVGTTLTELVGHELTGRYVDELYSRKVRREVIDAYRGVVEARLPHYRHARFWLVLKTLGYHRLILPFSSDGETVDTCLLALYPDRPDVTRAADWQRHIDRAELANWFGRPPKIEEVPDERESSPRA